MKPGRKSELVLSTFPDVKLPRRSRPGEFFEEFEAAVKRIPAGHAAEIDANRVTEHRARRYLGIMAINDPRYHEFRVRTTGGDVRRRVFVVNSGDTVQVEVSQ